MSFKLSDIFRVSGVAVVDSFTTRLIVHFIHNKFDKVVFDSKKCPLHVLFLRVIGRTILTSIVGSELHGLIYPFGFEDPTGGLFYLFGLAYQPLLWAEWDMFIKRLLKELTFKTLDAFPEAFPKTTNLEKNKPPIAEIPKVLNVKDLHRRGRNSVLASNDPSME